MGYRIKAKVVSNSDDWYYFNGFSQKGKLPDWVSEHESGKRIWKSKSSVTKAIDRIRETHKFSFDIVVEEI